MKTFNDFLETIPNQDNQIKLASLLTWIKDTYPELEPTIKWNQPMFIHHGTYIIGFSASKHHFALAPETKGIDRFKARATQSGYDVTKQLIKIKWAQDIDFGLIKDIIEFNIEDKKDLDTFWRP